MVISYVQSSTNSLYSFLHHTGNITRVLFRKMCNMIYTSPKNAFLERQKSLLYGLNSSGAHCYSVVSYLVLPFNCELSGVEMFS